MVAVWRIVCHPVMVQWCITEAFSFRSDNPFSSTALRIAVVQYLDQLLLHQRTANIASAMSDGEKQGLRDIVKIEAYA